MKRDPIVEGKPAQVRGVDGTYGWIAGTPAKGLSWVEDGAHPFAIVMLSRTLDVGALVEIANGASFDGATVMLSSAVDMKSVAVLAGSPWGTGAFAGGGSISYAPSEGGSPLDLGTSAGDFELASNALQWWFVDTSEASVNGRPGVVGTLDFSDVVATEDTITVEGDLGEVTALLWSPAPGSIATLTGPSSLDLVGLAESAEVVDEATWREYLTVHGDGGESFLAEESVRETTDAFDLVYESKGGESGAGYFWVLGTQGGDACFEIRHSRGTAATCSGIDEMTAESDPFAFYANELQTDGGNGLAAVVVRAGSDVSSLSEVTGEGEVTAILVDDVWWFVWVGPAPAQRNFILTTASGQESSFGVAGSLVGD